MAHAQSLLVSLYHDLTFQDIPAEFEDSINEFYGVDGGDEGWFLKLLKWDPAELRGDVSQKTKLYNSRESKVTYSALSQTTTRPPNP
jgi:exportin-2 (importin alpha re-exporter)